MLRERGVVLLGIVYVKVELASSKHTTVIATTRKISGQNKDDLSFTPIEFSLCCRERNICCADWGAGLHRQRQPLHPRLGPQRLLHHDRSVHGLLDEVTAFFKTHVTNCTKAAPFSVYILCLDTLHTFKVFVFVVLYSGFLVFWLFPQGADPLPLSFTRGKTGRNHLNKEITPLLPSGIG